MKGFSAKSHIIILLLLLTYACALRVFLFSGFVLGDDPAYADFVSHILRGSYPPIGTHSTFACRPILLCSIALPIYVFGWTEASFVLPILLASLMNIALVYFAGNKLGGPVAGVLAAVIYATFPLDVVNATTLTNDILLSSFVWGGVCILLLSYDKYDQKKYLLVTALSGLVTGLGVSVKMNALVAPAILVTALAMVLRSNIRQGGYKTIACWIMGWLVANGLICLFFYGLSGDFLVHYHAEKRFNLDYNPSGYVPGKANLISFLLYYPMIISGIAKIGHHGHEFMPYGYFFLCFFLCVPLAASKRFRELRLPAMLALSYLLIMEFAPMKAYPDYVPIHRLPRFLHIASMPAALTMGIAFSMLAQMRHRLITPVAWLVLILFTASSLYWACVKAAFYNDSARDQRWAWDVVKDASVKQIITDREMRNYLMFRSGFQPRFDIRSPDKLPKNVPGGCLVIQGGARRPDFDPGYAKNWHGNRGLENSMLVSEADFPLRPWRLSNIQIYQTNPSVRDIPMPSDAPTASQAKLSNSRHLTVIQGMRKIAELDVGKASSEKKLGYQVLGQSWSGTRNFAYPNGSPCDDDGNAHQEKESMTLQNLVPNQDIVILKRLDPTVINQVVDVMFNGKIIGKWFLDKGGIPGRWHESRFNIPSKFVTGTTGTLSFIFVESTCDINGFYYWFFQTR